MEGAGPARRLWQPMRGRPDEVMEFLGASLADPLPPAWLWRRLPRRTAGAAVRAGAGLGGRVCKLSPRFIYAEQRATR